MTIRAIYENGVFRPRETVSLPEHTEVSLAFEREENPHGINTSSEGMEKIYEILSERYDGGDTEVAAKHNEHQP